MLHHSHYNFSYAIIVAIIIVNRLISDGDIILHYPWGCMSTERASPVKHGASGKIIELLAAQQEPYSELKTNKDNLEIKRVLMNALSQTGESIRRVYYGNCEMFIEGLLCSFVSVSGIFYFKKWFLLERNQKNGSNVDAYQLTNVRSCVDLSWMRTLVPLESTSGLQALRQPMMTSTDPMLGEKAGDQPPPEESVHERREFILFTSDSTNWNLLFSVHKRDSDIFK
ncbi:hypothetical protein STEG23_014132, partial [Scotinomys teguina]